MTDVERDRFVDGPRFVTGLAWFLSLVPGVLFGSVPLIPFTLTPTPSMRTLIPGVYQS